MQQGGPGGIDAVEADVGNVGNGFRGTEQPDDQVQVVDVDIVEGTAGEVNVKGRQYLPLQVFVIAAGILGVVGLHHGNPAQLWQQLPELGVVWHVQQGDRLKEKELFALCQLCQQLYFPQIGSKWLFHDDVFASQQRLPGIGEMGAVDEPDIDEIYVRVLEKFVVVGIDGGDMVLFCQGFPLFQAVGTDEDSRYLYFLYLLQGKKNFLDDAAGACDT